jgi:hypothetical protein
LALYNVRPIADYEVFGEGLVTDPRELAKLEVADYTVVGPDKRGKTYFFGEVINKGSEPATEIEVTMSLVNAQGQTRDVDNTIDSAILVAPGEKLPFVITSYAPRELWESPSFQVQGFTLKGLSESYTGIYEDIKVEGLDTLEKSYGTGFKLNGEVTNTGSSEAKVSIAGVIYDAQGKIVDVDTTVIHSFKSGESQDVMLQFFVAEEAPDFRVLYGALAEAY